MSYNSDTIDRISSANSPEIIQPGYNGVAVSASVHKIIKGLNLLKHPEGGYYDESDRSPFVMENPYYPGHNTGVGASHGTAGSTDEPTLEIEDPDTGDKRQLTPVRNFSTLIHYLITSDSPLGRFHVNRSRIIHILQKGRGQYVLIYPDGHVKTFVVGFNTDKGEVDQWVVPGGVYKASFLIPLDEDKGVSGDDHLLISEIVVPGFDFQDHKFMPNKAVLEKLVGKEKAQSLEWLLGKKS